MKTKERLNQAVVEKRSSRIEKERRRIAESLASSQSIPAFDYSGILTVLLRRWEDIT